MTKTCFKKKKESGNYYLCMCLKLLKPLVFSQEVAF